MPKTKKKPPIKGIKQVPKDKLTVVKSNPLTSLWRSDLTLAEFKILDAYLARINSHEPEKRQVEFSKEEFEKVFGLSKFNLKELDARLNHLIGQAVRISDGDYRHGFAYVSLFEEARVEADDNGVQTVYLECTNKAMKYFFNCDNLGYLRYKLQSVKEMKSRYTYVLFLYLEKNRFRMEWTVSIDELKIMLNCESDDTYSEFKFFNQKILKRCQTEIQEKTECKFDYEPIRKGRKVTDIKFTVYPLCSLPKESDPNQLPLFGTDDEETTEQINNLNFKNERLEFFAAACNGEFSEDEMQMIFDILVKIIPNGNDLELKRYDYLEKKYHEMNYHKPKNRFAYLKKMLESEKA